MSVKSWLWGGLVDWMTRDEAPNGEPVCDFERLSYELRPGDVILVEGRSHIADVIKAITQSPWTHSMLFMGRLHDIDSHALREKVRNYREISPDSQLVIEALMQSGTVITPLERYRFDHLRICRPRGLSPADAQSVIRYALSHLGSGYDMRQVLDLARFMFPYGILPGRWRSSLFRHNAGGPTKNVCSTMLANAFMSVGFPILPVVKGHGEGELRFYPRNPRLFTPKDFDYSPYFDIVKYPFWGGQGTERYRRFPWSEDPLIYPDTDECYPPSLTPLPNGGSDGQA